MTCWAAEVMREIHSSDSCTLSAFSLRGTCPRRTMLNFPFSSLSTCAKYGWHKAFSAQSMLLTLLSLKSIFSGIDPGTGKRSSPRGRINKSLCFSQHCTLLRYGSSNLIQMAKVRYFKCGIPILEHAPSMIDFLSAQYPRII